MESFDYVIIGAGAAGCVLANRLSEDPGASVLLLEAGGDDRRPQISDPARWFETLGSDIDWGYLTEPQPHLAGRCIPWPRGRVLGGSTSINTMVHMRGSRVDYDGWARAGNTGWDYGSVLPAFRDLEDFPGGDPRYRGVGGPLRVAIPERHSPYADAVAAAAVELGHPHNEDFNGASVEGVGWNQLTVADGVRQSASVAFLRPALGRPNLTLRTLCRVFRLAIDARGNVTAVEYASGGTRHAVAAEREVVLAAGAVESPALLLRSGVGAAADLQGLGIDVRVDLPGVGRNLHDHPGVVVTWASRQPVVPPQANPGSEVGLFCRTGPAVSAPDLQFGILDIALSPDGMPLFEQAFSFYPSLLHPRSRGELTLRSADPDEPPRIDPAYLSEEEDLRGLVRAVEISRELAGTEAMREWTGEELSPGPAVTGREAVADYVRHAANTWFHPVGTCRMGVGPDTVVDPALRVHGCANLRVADASVMPAITSGNTNAPTLMIAWRAADLLTGRATPRTAGSGGSVP